MREKVSPATQDAIAFIDRLCEQNIIVYPIDYETCYPSDKELAETMKCWFGGTKWSENDDSFVQFGADGTGSLFLLWFYPSLKTDPPVVFMGSEGESCLVAPNINDFIRQIASGELFCLGGWCEPEADEDTELDWHKLRFEIENQLGKIDRTPSAISDRAAELHPDFTSWVEANIEY